MSDIKKRIIDASRELFNQNGIQKTTLRSIANQVGISQGNLNYHFTHKEEIIEQLYFELVKKMNEGVAFISFQTNLLGMVYQASVELMLKMIDYKFFLRDFYTLMREHEPIRMHFETLQEQRKNEFSIIFKQLEQQGFIRAEEFDDEYIRLYKRMAILGDNWINSLEIIDITSDSENRVRYYAELLFEILYPYLTTNGKEAWNDIDFEAPFKPETN